MADLNVTFLMGRLTADPELRRTASGVAVTELRLAVNKKWKGKDGEQREEVLFIGATVWDRSAENCCQYLRKGSGVHVQGSLKLDQWDDKTTGEKKSKIGVNADWVQFLDGKPRDGAPTEERHSEPSQPSTASRAPVSAPVTRPPAGRPSANPADFNYVAPIDDDPDSIPF